MENFISVRISILPNSLRIRPLTASHENNNSLKSVYLFFIFLMVADRPFLGLGKKPLRWTKAESFYAN